MKSKKKARGCETYLRVKDHKIERSRLEMLALDWNRRGKEREPSVRAVWETCAEQLAREIGISLP